jgi:hypothetical protein
MTHARHPVMTTVPDAFPAVRPAGDGHGDAAIRSVHHDVARLDAERAVHKSEDWPSNVLSIAKARARRRTERQGRSGDDQGKRREP